MNISIDFDNTIAVSRYPKIGKLMAGAKETINKWYNNHTIIINTCRAGEFMDDCRHFLDLNGINYHFINENNPETIKLYGTDTRKISGDVYFDDRSMGGFCGWKKADKYIEWMENRKPVILCIVGESGSGKTTMAEYIETNFGVPSIESYTTRPKRSPNETGHTFITDGEFNQFDRKDMIAFTEFGGYRYCCLKEDVGQENVYVIDEAGLRYLRDNFSDIYDIKSIRLTCGKSERIERVGQERVERDKGKFTMPYRLFDFFWETDSRKDKSLHRNQEFEQLDNFINKCFGRGWN